MDGVYPDLFLAWCYVTPVGAGGVKLRSTGTGQWAFCGLLTGFVLQVWFPPDSHTPLSVYDMYSNQYVTDTVQYWMNNKIYTYYLWQHACCSPAQPQPVLLICSKLTIWFDLKMHYHTMHTQSQCTTQYSPRREIPVHWQQLQCLILRGLRSGFCRVNVTVLYRPV